MQDSECGLWHLFTHHLQWGKKVFSQPPIVQVFPLKKMREACNFHHRYTSTMRDKMRKKKSRKSHCLIFKEFICKLWWKISIWSITKVHLNTLLYTLCWQWQRSNVFCKSSQAFHTVAGILAHSSMQISSRAVMFWGCHWATRTFNSLHRFSMALRSGDWLGHSRTLKCFLRSHSFVARAVCLGSLSCWKTQPRFIFNALADGRWFSLQISRYMAPFILSFTRISRPGPLAEKQPQSMMFPPPCFTVGMVFFGCNSAFFLLQTRRVEFLPKSYILVSSDHHDILPILFWIIQML